MAEPHPRADCGGPAARTISLGISPATRGSCSPAANSARAAFLRGAAGVGLGLEPTTPADPDSPGRDRSRHNLTAMGPRGSTMLTELFLSGAAGEARNSQRPLPTPIPLLGEIAADLIQRKVPARFGDLSGAADGGIDDRRPPVVRPGIRGRPESTPRCLRGSIASENAQRRIQPNMLAVAALAYALGNI